MDFGREAAARTAKGLLIKPALQRWERAARYALLVSIRAPEAEIDIYNSIATQLAVPIPAG
jgi:hypothetical protein